jgi:hypothetical protein
MIVVIMPSGSGNLLEECEDFGGWWGDLAHILGFWLCNIRCEHRMRAVGQHLQFGWGGWWIGLPADPRVEGVALWFLGSGSWFGYIGIEERPQALGFGVVIGDCCVDDRRSDGLG